MRFQIRQIHSISTLTLFTIAAIVLSVSFLMWELYEQDLEHARQDTNALTEILMEQTLQSFEAADLVLQSVQERLSNNYGRQFALDSAPTYLLLSARAASVRPLSSIFLVDATGSVVNSSLDFPITRFSVADRAYFTHFARTGEKKLFIGKPVRSRINNEWTLYIALPLLHDNGAFRGVIVGAVNVTQFEQMYRTVKLGYTRPIALYGIDGTLIASLPHREQAIGEIAPELRHADFPSKAHEIRTSPQVNANGEPEVLSLGRLANYPLLMGVTDNVEQSLAPWRATVLPISLGAALVCIFTASIAFILISKLKIKEELAAALRVADDRYQHTVNSVMDAIVAIDESMHIVLFNPAAEDMFNMKKEQAIGQPIDLLLPESARERHRGHVARFADSQSTSRAMGPHLDITGRRSDGKVFPIESTIAKTMLAGKLQMTAVLRDVTERRQAETGLRTANQQLRHLSTSLQHVREQERSRLSRELHDELGQQLTGLKLSLSWLGTRIKDGRTATPDAIDEMRYQLDAAIASVRRISTELRPIILDELGLGEAMAWHIQEFAKRSALDIETDLAAAEHVQGDALATALFRIVQEALTNVIRHAHATKVKVTLVHVEQTLVLTIQDNGRGFQYTARPEGIGLVSMRERAHSVGATFNIMTTPGLGLGHGVGTTIEVTIALNVEQRNGAEA